MKIRMFAVSLLLLVGLLPAVIAQDAESTAEPSDTSPSHTVMWDDYTLTYTESLARHVLIRHEDEGSAGDGAYVWPQSVEMSLYPESEVIRADIPYEDRVIVSFFKAEDVASVPLYQELADNLRNVLTDRPDLSNYEWASNEPVSTLPRLEPINAATVLIARAHYLETETFTGIAYLMVGRQYFGPFKGDEFIYMFQGYSRDEGTYVSVSTVLETPLFPLEPTAEDMALFESDTPYADLEAYFAQSVAKVNDAAPSDFYPNLDDIEAMIQTITVK